MARIINESELSISSQVDEIVNTAVNNRASDIHLEPQHNDFIIKYRIDGMIYVSEKLTHGYHKPITNRIKVLASLDITQQHIPQDGNFEFSTEKRTYNIRVSTYPTIFGESLVLRILDRGNILLELELLGFDKSQLNTMQRLISGPNGMILITGPSGSGKTTLLYSVINSLNKPTNNIITIEDPVELRLRSVRQAQTNIGRKFNFVSALRAILRQDPDIIMVGEIRDSETAQIASQSALSGSLVLSTFHTINVFAVITRLIEMDVPRSIIAHSIAGVVSARLVRKICTECKVPYQLNEVEKKQIRVHDLSSIRFYKGKGCNHCLQTGYYGRIGIFEILPFDNEIRSIIAEQQLLSAHFYTAQRKRTKSLGESGLDKVYQGITTIEEVLRVAGQLY